MRDEVLRPSPPGVTGVDVVDACDMSPLFAEECEAVARAVFRRVAEFRAGRHCAREALARVGLPRAALPVLRSRAPAWPAGVVGSISHCDGYYGAVVARVEDVGAIGFDVELTGRVSQLVWSDIATDAKLSALHGDAHQAIDELATGLFSVKESYFTAQHPRHQLPLEFLDVTFALLDTERACRSASTVRQALHLALW